MASKEFKINLSIFFDRKSCSSSMFLSLLCLFGSFFPWSRGGGVSGLMWSASTPSLLVGGEMLDSFALQSEGFQCCLPTGKPSTLSEYLTQFLLLGLDCFQYLWKFFCRHTLRNRSEGYYGFDTVLAQVGNTLLMKMN